MKIPEVVLITCVLITTPLFVSCVNNVPKNLLVNPGFEETADNQEAVAWTVSQHAGKKAYEYEIDTEIFFQGKQSFRIKQYTDQAYGLVKQTSVLPETGNRNVIFTAMLKADDVESGKGWRLVLNCRAANSRVLKQYQSESLDGTTGWKKVTLEGEIPVGTVKFDAGIMLQSQGTGWVDDVYLGVN